MLPDWFIPVMSLMFGLLSGVGSIAWGLSRQFANLRTSIYDKIEKMQSLILDKLEYHERHDDQRFSEIKNDIWSMRVRNAVNEAKRSPDMAKQIEEHT